jgi:hypothetical protein
MALTKVTYSMILGASVNVLDYGVVGNGVANDTAAIQAAVAAVKAAGGGTLYFPKGTYKVVFPSGLSAYSSLFALPSNTGVMFDQGAEMQASAVTGSSLFASVFGVDKTALPVSNLRFEGVNITQAAAGGGQELGQAITLESGANSAALSITNVIINGCSFTGFGSAIYILQRTSTGTTTRQVSGVTVTNNFGAENVSFITPDGEGIIIDGNNAYGFKPNPAGSFDAVSIHSGANIRVTNNDFSYYGEFGVNVRNSPENLCGSSNIVIDGNIIHSILLKCVGIYLQPGESVYGVRNVVVSNNNFSHGSDTNTGIGTYVDFGSGDTATPFDRFTVSGNTFFGLNNSIIVQSPLPEFVSNVSITGNSSFQKTTNTGYALKLTTVVDCVVSGNTFTYAYTGASADPVNVNYFYNSSFTGNMVAVYSTDAQSIRFNNLNDVAMSGNMFYGPYFFNTLNNTCVIEGNRFVNAGTVEGRTLVSSWDLDQGKITVSSSAVPVTGTWKVGDIAYTITPASAGYIGSVCTVAGTPGTWNSFGLIA